MFKTTCWYSSSSVSVFSSLSRHSIEEEVGNWPVFKSFYGTLESRIPATLGTSQSVPIWPHFKHNQKHIIGHFNGQIGIYYIAKAQLAKILFLPVQ